MKVKVKRILAVAIIASMSVLPGCVAVPIVAAANAVHKSGTAVVDVAGPAKSFPRAFRSAVQKVGGMVTATGPEYGHAVFSRESVKIEYQKIGEGRYQIVTASDGNVSRVWDFSDTITAKSKAVADNLSAAGYTITITSRQRGI